MFRAHEKESGSQHYQCSSVAVLAFFVVIRTTLSLRWKCLEMVRTAVDAGLPRAARAHQRLARLAAATRAGVFPLPEALAVAAVGRRHGQGRQRQAQGRRQGQERVRGGHGPASATAPTSAATAGSCGQWRPPRCSIQRRCTGPLADAAPGRGELWAHPEQSVGEALLRDLPRAARGGPAS